MILNDSLKWGRLCNQIFRSIAISMLAQKHNLKVQQYPLKYIDSIHKLGIILFNGTNNYSHTKKLNDNNYLSYLHTKNINNSFSIDLCYFQTKEISNLIFNYISTTCKDNIIKCNKFKERYNNNNDIFIHFRLGDVIKIRIKPDYYINIINTINYNNIYISSDSLNDKEILKIKEMFKNVHLIDHNEIDTIHFGSTCKNVILSHGSFSAIIGYMAFYSNVYCYKNNTWCPNMFIDKGFIANI